MPDIDRTGDIKVTAAQGIVTAEMPRLRPLMWCSMFPLLGVAS